MMYLKAKYPRSAQSFAPGDLMDLFKNFDNSDNSAHDSLKNCKIYFNNPE
jgi:hypothetical protein